MAQHGGLRLTRFQCFDRQRFSRMVRTNTKLITSPNAEQNSQIRDGVQQHAVQQQPVAPTTAANLCCYLRLLQRLSGHPTSAHPQPEPPTTIQQAFAPQPAAHLEGGQDVVLPGRVDVAQDEVLVGRDGHGQLVPLNHVAQRLLGLPLHAPVLRAGQQNEDGVLVFQASFS